LRFSELWRLSSVVYKEISFQSIFSLRAGSLLKQKGKTDIERLVSNARTNTLMSKIITAIFMAVFGSFVFVSSTVNTTLALSRELAFVGGVSAFLAGVLFLIAFMGLQVTTSFVSSKVVDVLGPLPLSRNEISRVIFLCLMRIFDLPLISAHVVFLAAYLLIGGPILGALIAVVCIFATEVFALALTIGLAGFFYSRVARGGRSKWQVLTRFLFMFVWILPTFAAYFIMSFSGQIVQSFTSFAQSFSSLLQVLVLVYPFSYGFLMSHITFPNGFDNPSLSLSVVASIGYMAAAAYCLNWIAKTAGRIGTSQVVARRVEATKDTFVKPRIPWLGIIHKDLRVASRTPSYASLFLLPFVQSALLAVSFSLGGMDLTKTLGMLVGVSLMTLLLPPTLLSIEGISSAYVKSLPMKKKSLISAKTLLSVGIYLLSLIVLLAVSLYLRQDLSLIIMFGSIHTLSISAAIILEVTILTNRFWKEGFAVGNLYSRLSSYILILILGFVVVLLPIVAAFTAFILAPHLVSPVFAVIACVEFAVMVTVASRVS
jgi:predicted permease